MSELVGIIYPPRRPAGGSLEGTTFVITGTLSQPRSHFQKLIKAAGGKASGSIGQKTDFLLAGEKAGSKLDKAEKFGVPIIDEASFFAMIGK
jgi:DNA ligase (NAD+)